MYSLIVERSLQGIYTETSNTEYNLKSHITAQIRLFSQLINVCVLRNNNSKYTHTKRKLSRKNNHKK